MNSDLEKLLKLMQKESEDNNKANEKETNILSYTLRTVCNDVLGRYMYYINLMLNENKEEQTNEQEQN